ncbi:MAG: transaldolase [Bacteroidota bacterium]
MQKPLLYLLLVTMMGCGSGVAEYSGTFFAGEIVNPTHEYVVLFKGETVVDSALLDENNRFVFTLDSLQSGLYHFKHNPEYQYVYLNEADSLWIRLNTMDFDESLIFSGNGAEVNNFLLELFLASEKEKSFIYELYTLGPEEFNQEIDSLKRSKLALLEILDKETGLLPKEKEIAQASIVYHYNTFKERYPFTHKKYAKDGLNDKLPDDFYAYRKEITFNNADFTYLRPYYNFMTNHFGNLAYMSYTKKCGEIKGMVKNHLHFNTHKLELIDSLVEDGDLRDNLFRNVAFDYLLEVHDTEANNQKFIERFHELSGSNKHSGEVDDLYEAIRNIQPNKEIPDIRVVDNQGNTVSLRDIAKDSKTVFYFWSGTDRRHFDNITKRAAYLSKKMSKHRFIGISLRTDDAKWKRMMEDKDLNEDSQYRAEDFEAVAKSLIIYPMNKCIITEDAKIVNAFSDMYASSF